MLLAYSACLYVLAELRRRGKEEQGKELVIQGWSNNWNWERDG